MPRLRLLFLLLFAATALAGQPLRIDYFTVNDGLSSPEINHLHLGDDGYVWVSTMDGLNRFDGQNFRRFGEGTTDGPGLSRSAIAAVQPDNEGKFIVTFHEFFGYFDRFDPRDFSVEQVRLAPSTGVLGYPRAITTDTLGRTFVVTIGREGTFLYEYTPRSAADQPFTVIHHDSTDAWTTLTPQVELLVHSDGSFLLYDEEHGFRHLSPTGALLGRPFADLPVIRRLYWMAEAADGRVLMSQRAGFALYAWRPGDADPVPVLQDETELRYPKVFRDRANQLLMTATEDILGLEYPVEYGLVDRKGKFSIYEDSGLPLRRKVSAVAAIDFRGTTYLGLDEGVGVLQRARTAVRTYLPRRSDDLFNNRVTGVTSDDAGNVYALTYDGGLFRVAPDGLSVDTIRLRLERDTTTELSFRSGTGLVYDAAGDRLFGVAQPAVPERGGLLFSYDLRRRTTREYRFEQPPLTLALGADQRVYVSVSDPRQVGMVLRWNERSGRCESLPTPAAAVPFVGGFVTNALRAAPDGRLLLATDTRGLLAYDPVGERLEELLAARPPGLDPDNATPAVLTIHRDTTGYWLGTDAGLLHYASVTDPPVRYDRAAGLSSNIVLGILPDTTGGYWISTEHGLTHVPANRASGGLRRYYREDGLANDEFQPNSYHKTRSGEYFFGGINGLTAFRDDDFPRVEAGSDLMLTEVTVVGRDRSRVIRKNLKQLRQVTVFAREKGIAVSFAVPAGQVPGGGRFRYRLEGFNDDWVPLVNERTVRFNNLAAGSYTLRVQAAGPNGNYGEKELVLLINVRQYIIERVWFQVLMILFILGLIGSILQGRLRERLRNEQLRTQLSSDIHDEVSGLLAGITLQAELLRGRTEDEVMQAKLQRVGDAGRQAMSKMSDVIWSIDSRRDTIGNLLQRMQEHADEVLLPLEIRYDFRVAGLDEDRELAGNVRQDLYFIYKEAVNNVARHSRATRVEIEVEQFAQYFELLVRDDGPRPAVAGTSPAAVTRDRAQKSGQGMDNMRMRAERLGGELIVRDQDKFTVVFRMKRLG